MKPKNRVTQKMKSLALENRLVIRLVVVIDHRILLIRVPPNSGPLFERAKKKRHLLAQMRSKVSATIQLATCGFVNTERASEAADHAGERFS